MLHVLYILSSGSSILFEGVFNDCLLEALYDLSVLFMLMSEGYYLVASERDLSAFLLQEVWLFLDILILVIRLSEGELNKCSFAL